MTSRLYGKIAAAFLSAVIAAGCLLPVSAENEENQKNGTAVLPNADESGYTEYLSSAYEAYRGNDILLSGADFTSEEGSGVRTETAPGENDILIWESTAGTVSYSFDVPQNASYNISLTYLPLEESTIKPAIGVRIDGEYPFESCDRIGLERFWTDADDQKHTDSVGNEYSPEQKLYENFITRSLTDENGIITKPYVFSLTAGTHVLTIEAPSQGISIASVALTAPSVPLSYNDISKTYLSYEKYSADPIVIEGEDAVLKNSASLTAKCENGSALVTPSSATLSVLNYIGGTTWKSPGTELVWEFDAPEDGLYKIGFSFKQSDITNGYSYRQLKIDGKVPFDEAYTVKFGYSISWEFEAFENEEGESYLIYLTKGRHTVSLTATLGEMSEYYTALQELVLKISELYLDIIMITGESPDANRDYDLFKQIPGFNETLEEIESGLNALGEKMESTTSGGGSQYISNLNSMARILRSMRDNPYTAQRFLSDYYTQYTNLGAMLSDMINMPLKLDQIRIAAPDGEFENKTAGFFSRTAFGIKRFAASFVKKYSQVSAADDGEDQLTIWCNWGRDQAMVLSSLIQQSFTANTGINVNLELTNASLIKGIISDTQPDLQLHMSRTEPVNLAMRGALYDLSDFDDYEDVMERFGDSAGVPYEYNGGHYALPDTQNFYIMFYRSDILNELGIAVPETWDEFLKASASILRNNMTVYLPYTEIVSTTTVNTGVGGLNLFASIMQQYGIGMYNDGRTKCSLEDPLSLSAFSFWTEMYTKYKVPTTQNFYNRFKVGTCPIGIEVYTQYTQLDQAAPEIDGCWGIALVPGVQNSDGTINRSVSGSGTGCAILAKSERKEEAWEFLKWWTSAETQLAYNNGVESILGTISRTSTSNLEAFSAMSWDRDDLKILLEQREEIVEVPEVPGSYYVARAVDQAFWSVVNGQSNEKDALIKWGEIANNEIARKIRQYS